MNYLPAGKIILAKNRYKYVSYDQGKTASIQAMRYYPGGAKQRYKAKIRAYADIS